MKKKKNRFSRVVKGCSFQRVHLFGGLVYSSEDSEHDTVYIKIKRICHFKDTQHFLWRGEAGVALAQVITL